MDTGQNTTYVLRFAKYNHYHYHHVIIIPAAVAAQYHNAAVGKQTSTVYACRTVLIDDHAAPRTEWTMQPGQGA